MGLKDPELKAIRAKEIIMLKTEKGMTNQEIANQMGVHKDTVMRALTWARKAGLFVQYEDQILQDVVPKAIAALKMALEDGDGELAIKVLNNTLWATQQKGQNKSNGASAPTHEPDVDDLSSYIAQIRQKAQEEEELADGEVVESNEERVVGLLGASAETSTTSSVGGNSGEGPPTATVDAEKEAQGIDPPTS